MLDNLNNKKNPFKVPENYFEDFNTKIMEQLPVTEKASKIVPLWKKILPLAVAVAACVAVLFTVLPMININSKPDQTSIASSTISEDEIFEIMEDQLIASKYQDVLFEEVYAK